MDRTSAARLLRAEGLTSAAATAALRAARDSPLLPVPAGAAWAVWSSRAGYTVAGTAAGGFPPRSAHGGPGSAVAADAAGQPGFRPDGTLAVAARRDGSTIWHLLLLPLPGTPDPAAAARTGGRAAALIAREPGEAAVAAFGPPGTAVAAAQLTALALHGTGMKVAGLVHVDQDWSWCLCGNPGCADGSPAAAPAIALAARTAAAGIACQQDGPALARAYVNDATAAFRAGIPCPPGTLAGCLAAVNTDAGGGRAWALADPAHATADARLWSALEKSAPPEYRSAVSALLACAAWHQGDADRALQALQRAETAAPPDPAAGPLRKLLAARSPALRVRHLISTAAGPAAPGDGQVLQHHGQQQPGPGSPPAGVQSPPRMPAASTVSVDRAS